MREVRQRFWVETVAGGASALLAVLTVFWHDWIEVTGWDPDQHSGSAEWMAVVVLAVIAVTAGVFARREWRRAPVPA